MLCALACIQETKNTIPFTTLLVLTLYGCLVTSRTCYYCFLYKELWLQRNLTMVTIQLYYELPCYSQMLAKYKAQQLHVPYLTGQAQKLNHFAAFHSIPDFSLDYYNLPIQAILPLKIFAHVGVYGQKQIARQVDKAGKHTQTLTHATPI